MRLHRGVHPELEAEADRLLKEQLATIKRPSEKSDILTPWKEQDRRRREVYVSDGVPDPANRSGVYHRVLNTKQGHLNSATPGSLLQRRGSISRQGSGS